MACSVNFSKKLIVFITGASKGIGRSIAVEISRNLEQNSVLVLIARSEKGLEETKAQVMEIDKSITVLTYTLDLSKPNLGNYNDMFQHVLKSIDRTGIEFGLIFHNAGHVGTLKATTGLTELEVWQEYYNLNMFSVVLLNSAFIKNIRPIAPQLVSINITSLCGRVPFTNMSMYGSAKAARDLFFKVLAIEEPGVIVLNYSPGPVDTDMYSDVIVTAESEELKKMFKENKESQILTPAQTVSKLLEILEKGSFKNGDTIDYYDKV